MVPPSLRPALFLDRDGVINVDTGFLHRIEECRFVEGIFDLTLDFARRGFAIVIATNQSGIGRGLFGEADYEELMAWMRGAFARSGVAIDGIYHCPDHPTEGIGPYRRENPRRKPGPGMFLEAARELSVDLRRSWCVGDRLRDIEAGRAAGIGTLVLLDEASDIVRREADYWIVPDLAAITSLPEPRPSEGADLER